ncbi:pVI [Simian adenovirus 16]|uniref:Pre-protein VI n=1 Tax=Simian adenovirus 16 TaxID=1715778 RepID=A0A0M3TH11_9ADEN|nr:pVI [Simian adenovirus 16]ALE30396.1 pVI [Simian adenovirus 16]
MEDINFSSLAPRHGSRPYMGTWNDIGTSQLNGGAFSWSGLWSGIKNFGSTVKNYGVKAWNSSTGQMLRDKLKDQNFQQKVVDGLASGINGVVDLANQAVQKQIASRLDPPPPAVEVEPSAPPMEVEEKAPPLEVVLPPKGEKRPRPDAEEETLVTKTIEPPSYEEAVRDSPPAYPMTRPVASMARPVLGTSAHKKGVSTLDLPPPPAAVTVPALAPPTVPSVPATSLPVAAARPVAVATPARIPRGSRQANWQSTLNSIVGLGVRSLKRRRCY